LLRRAVFLFFFFLNGFAALPDRFSLAIACLPRADALRLTTFPSAFSLRSLLVNPPRVILARPSKTHLRFVANVSSSGGYVGHSLHLQHDFLGMVCSNFFLFLRTTK
jgi:hypothetical protein